MTSTGKQCGMHSFRQPRRIHICFQLKMSGWLVPGCGSRRPREGDGDGRKQRGQGELVGRGGIGRREAGERGEARNGKSGSSDRPKDQQRQWQEEGRFFVQTSETIMLNMATSEMTQDAKCEIKDKMGQGKVLGDKNVVKEIFIDNGSTVHLMERLRCRGATRKEEQEQAGHHDDSFAEENNRTLPLRKSSTKKPRRKKKTRTIKAPEHAANEYSNFGEESGHLHCRHVGYHENHNSQALLL